MAESRTVDSTTAGAARRTACSSRGRKWISPMSVMAMRKARALRSAAKGARAVSALSMAASASLMAGAMAWA